MKSQLLSNHGGIGTYVLVFDTGDDVMPLLVAAAQELRLSAASFTAIGAFSEATLGFFDLDRRDYARIPVREQVEVLSLAGNVALADGEPKVHAHVVVGRRDGTAMGGHLLDARVRPTLEVTLVETPATLQRKMDHSTGLPLIEAGA